jgi:hypothetical protein
MKVMPVNLLDRLLRQARSDPGLFCQQDRRDRKGSFDLIALKGNMIGRVRHVPSIQRTD